MRHLAVVGTPRLPRPAAELPDGRVIARVPHTTVVQVRAAVEPLHVVRKVAQVPGEGEGEGRVVRVKAMKAKEKVEW